MSQKIAIRRALISVSDKTGLAEFAAELHRTGVEILSTGGTLKLLNKNGIPAKAVDAYTGFPEMLDGRVKTLHPKIHGGLLFRRDLEKHRAEAQKHGIQPIDLVVVNLYPFEKVTQNPDVDLEEAIENIDIGGPSMLRSAAKNADAVTVVCDPADYAAVLTEMKKNQGAVSGELRRKLARKVFARTSAYDQAIAQFLASKESAAEGQETLPSKWALSYGKIQDLRYGENPHQRAAFYGAPGGTAYEQLHGKELSFNNLLDIDAAVNIVDEFPDPAVCVVKHNNPCGIAQDADLSKALKLAIDCDSMSAFGGIIGLNRPCDQKTAEIALEQLKFFEVFVAPSYEPAALKLLQERKNLRIIATGQVNDQAFDLRLMRNGLLLQDKDPSLRKRFSELKKNLKIVTKKKPSEADVEALLFAWICVKTVKSNAIVITQGKQTVGIGAGQMSRVDAVFMACHKAGARSQGGFLASDAFFPMPDSIEEAHAHNIRAIIQPGGSIKDQDVIDACDRHGLAMVFTGQRHFRH